MQDYKMMDQIAELEKQHDWLKVVVPNWLFLPQTIFFWPL